MKPFVSPWRTVRAVSSHRLWGRPSSETVRINKKDHERRQISQTRGKLSSKVVHRDIKTRQSFTRKPSHRALWVSFHRSPRPFVVDIPISSDTTKSSRVEHITPIAPEYDQSRPSCSATIVSVAFHQRRQSQTCNEGLRKLHCSFHSLSPVEVA